MPYVREGAIKVSDHHVRSPLLNISRSCQTCHRFPEEQLKATILGIQDRHRALMLRAEDALVQLITAVEKARKSGLDEGALAQVFEFQRKAQWRVDFINAENSMGFHAPQEAARILGESIDYSRQGYVSIAALLEMARPSTPSIATAPLLRRSHWQRARLVRGTGRLWSHQGVTTENSIGHVQAGQFSNGTAAGRGITAWGAACARPMFSTSDGNHRSADRSTIAMAKRSHRTIHRSGRT